MACDCLRACACMNACVYCAIVCNEPFHFGCACMCCRIRFHANFQLYLRTCTHGCAHVCVYASVCTQVCVCIAMPMGLSVCEKEGCMCPTFVLLLPLPRCFITHTPVDTHTSTCLKEHAQPNAVCLFGNTQGLSCCAAGRPLVSAERRCRLRFRSQKYVLHSVWYMCLGCL